jgi:signal peptide peptidase SppA
MKYPHIASRIFNSPLLIHPMKLDAIIAGLSPRLFGSPVIFQQAAPNQAEVDAISPEMFTTRRGERTDAGYRVADGVAVIPVMGALAHRSKLDADSNYILGYNEVAGKLEDAMSQPASDVHAVLMYYDSPGGEVAGAFELAQRMFDYRGKKPMWSMADNLAASAAYLGASASDHVALTNTSYAGSIGVVMRHVDFSRMLANEGITVTQIFEGAHKVDGNPYEALPAAVRADFQAELKKLYGMFVDAVAEHRGLDRQAVIDTEARVFMGAEAVSKGLADRVASTDQLISELAGKRAHFYPAGASGNAQPGGNSMSDTKPAAGGNQPANNQPAAAGTFTQADVDTARAEGNAAGVKAERERASGILAHKEATGRAGLAVQCVANGLSVEASAAILAAAPQGNKTNALADAMAHLGNPDVKAGGEEDAAALEPKAVEASWNKAFKVKTDQPTRH